MAANLRGVACEKHDRHAWHWHVAGVRWDYRTFPGRKLYRAGHLVPFSSKAVLCLDDAIVYSLGYTSGIEGGLSAGREVRP